MPQSFRLQHKESQQFFIKSRRDELTHGRDSTGSSWVYSMPAILTTAYSGLSSKDCMRGIYYAKANGSWGREWIWQEVLLSRDDGPGI